MPQQLGDEGSILDGVADALPAAHKYPATQSQQVPRVPEQGAT